MTIDQAYLEYTMKAEKNITNDGLSTDKGRFCMRFNNMQISYLRGLLQNKGEDDVRYAEKFLLPGKPISYSSKTNEVYVFNLPDNFFDLGDVRGLATKGSCKNQELYLYEVNPENYTEYLRNENTTPSFKWRESLYSLSENSVKVFYDDFEVNKILLSYYRYPQEIRLIDQYNPESDFNEDFPIEWDDKSIHRIIDLMVLDNDISSANPRVQLDALRFQQ